MLEYINAVKDTRYVKLSMGLREFPMTVTLVEYDR